MNKKSKSKVVLGLAAVLAATAGVAAVGTYAWFVTQDTAQVNFAHAHITSDNANIAVAYRPVTNNGIASGDITPNGTDAGFAIAATIQARDVSGDGKTMYRPSSWNGATPSGSVGTQDNTASVRYFVRFGINVTNKGADGTKVYIKGGTNLSALHGTVADAIATAALNGSRVSIWKGDETHDFATSETAPVTYWQQSTQGNLYSALADGGNGITYSYLQTVAGSTGKLYGLTGQPCQVADASALTGWHQGAWSDAAYDSTVAGQCLGTFTGGETKYFTLTMWLDGTISNDSAVGADVTLNMNLQGIVNPA
jgi:hypothetical protein